MADSENTHAPSKKRAAGRELSRDNPGLDDEEDDLEQETGTFKRASEEVLATRRIVKVRRQPTASQSTNPFAGIRLVPPTESTVNPVPDVTEGQTKTETPGLEGPEKVETNGKNESSIATGEEKKESDKQSEEKIDESEAGIKTDEDQVTADEETKPDIDKEAQVNETSSENPQENDKQNEDPKDIDKQDEGPKDSGNENTDSNEDATQLNSFQQLSSSQNAFSGLAGTGFSSSTFSFGSIPKAGSPLGASPGSLSVPKADKPSFGFVLSNNGNSSLFGSQGASAVVSKSEASSFPPKQEVPIETGEENEQAVFTADSVLFEFFDGGWKERGKGELKVNVSTAGPEKARLVMRSRGNYRLILNASLYPDMKLTNMDKKGITFACMNSTGEVKGGLSTFALKFKDGSIVEDFRSAVTAHKGKMTAILKTPENSPKASDD